MRLQILGCYAATPKNLNNPTSQLLETRRHLFLIDCGEGTQVALRKTKAKFARIKHIFISHLHGDHFYGLIGLISTFQLLGRTADLHIYGPMGIKDIILLQLKHSKSFTSFQLVFHELKDKESCVLFEDESIVVRTIPLEHRIYTNGFLFAEKPGERKLDVEAARKAGIDVSYFRRLKAGEDVVNEQGKTIPNERVTLPPDPPSSYAYCSDTAHCPGVVPIIKGVSALYHESTFLDTHRHLCEKTRHSTAAQAADIARQAGVGKLILGHYSTRYGDLSLFEKEAKPIFENTELADDFKVFSF